MAYQTGSEPLVRHEGKFIAMVVCWLLGNGSLFAWNSMLTIEDYYSHIFPSYHPTRILTLVYQPFAFGTLAVLTYHEARLNTRVRNLAGYSLFFISSALLIILDLATSGRGGIGPFIGVCISSGAFGVADALAQGGMVGDLSLMCPEFIQSFFAGLAASGALTSALRFITKAAFENSPDGLRKGAILFFAISAFIELLCVLLYAFVFPKLPIVKYYRSKAASEGSKTVSADLIAGGVPTNNTPEVEEDPKHLERLSNKQLLLENLDYAIDLYLIYVLTLSIFPGFLSEDTGSHSLGTWYVLVLIAMYNVWDLVGEIHAPDRMCKDRVTERPDARDHFPFLVHPGVLLHGQVRRSRVDDHADVSVRFNQRPSYRLCHYGRTQGLQGTGAKCIGELACSVSYRGIIVRSYARLVVAHRQRLVMSVIF